jgi:hypothetical protein
VGPGLLRVELSPLNRCAPEAIQATLSWKSADSTNINGGGAISFVRQDENYQQQGNGSGE